MPEPNLFKKSHSTLLRSSSLRFVQNLPQLVPPPPLPLACLAQLRGLSSFLRALLQALPAPASQLHPQMQLALPQYPKESLLLPQLLVLQPALPYLWHRLLLLPLVLPILLYHPSSRPWSLPAGRPLSQLFQLPALGLAYLPAAPLFLQWELLSLLAPKVPPQHHKFAGYCWVELCTQAPWGSVLRLLSVIPFPGSWLQAKLGQSCLTVINVWRSQMGFSGEREVLSVFHY